MILITYNWGLTVNINSSVYNFNNPLVISSFTIVHGVYKPTNITGGGPHCTILRMIRIHEMGILHGFQLHPRKSPSFRRVIEHGTGKAALNPKQEWMI